MNQKSKTWRGISDVRVKSLEKNTRSKASGCDIFRELEREFLLMIKNLSLFFLQINLSIPDTETKKIHRIMCFGNSSLFGTFSCNVQIYIDVTFNIIPIPFYQCLIVMVYKVQISVYVFVISIPDIETKKMYRIMFYGNSSIFRTLAGNV